MDARLQGILDWGKRRSLRDIIQSDDGYSLTDSEARRYVRWAIKQGYEYLSQVPDYEQVKDKI